MQKDDLFLESGGITPMILEGDSDDEELHLLAEDDDGEIDSSLSEGKAQKIIGCSVIHAGKEKRTDSTLKGISGPHHCRFVS